MKILVCMKAVPASAQVEMDAAHTLQRQQAGLQWNIADEAALEAALRRKDPEGHVTVLTMGPAKLEAPLRELLGRGADQAVLLTDPSLAGADTYATAKALAAAVNALGGFDLILCGRRAIDGETGQVPSMLAAALNLPCVTGVEQLDVVDGKLSLRRRLEGGTATLSVSCPAVVSICEYSYPLRLPGIAGMRRARQTPVRQLTAAQLGLSPEECGLQGSLTKVIRADKKFPGLRSCSRETDPAAFTEKLLAICREVKV